MIWQAAQIFAILLTLAVAVVWAERRRMAYLEAADLATPGQADDEETRILTFGPDVDAEQTVDVEAAVEDLEAIDRLLDAGELAEAQRQVRKLLEVLQGRDEAALADQRYLARYAGAAA